jgi:integrase
VHEYGTALRAAGRSPGTIRLHRYYLSSLAERHASPWQVTTPDLLAFLSVEHWAPETRKSARAAVRGFYRWAYGAGHLEEDPGDTLPSVRVPPGRPRPTPEHLVRVLVRHEDPRIGLMAMLAAYAGLRAAEIARVHASDLAGDTLVVHGKGGRVRGVPVLNELLLERLEALEGWAFPNGLGSHLSPGHVSRVLSRAMPESWTAHTLRHRMATTAYAGTRDLLAVGAVLGHSRPETTQRYVLLPDDALRAAVRAAG